MKTQSREQDDLRLDRLESGLRQQDLIAGCLVSIAESLNLIAQSAKIIVDEGP